MAVLARSRLGLASRLRRPVRLPIPRIAVGRMMANHPDLSAEQAYIDRAYSSLERSREEATRLRSMVEVGKGGTEQARWEREMIEGNIAQRLPPPPPGGRRLGVWR